MPSYKVKMVDGSWYTLGSGSQAKIRALDGSWYVENNAAPPEAKVRLLAGPLGPGVDFGRGLWAGAWVRPRGGSDFLQPTSTLVRAWNEKAAADFTSTVFAPPDSAAATSAVYSDSSTQVPFLTWDMDWFRAHCFPLPPYSYEIPVDAVGWQYPNGMIQIRDETPSGSLASYLATPTVSPQFYTGSPLPPRGFLTWTQQNLTTSWHVARPQVPVTFDTVSGVEDADTGTPTDYRKGYTSTFTTAWTTVATLPATATRASSWAFNIDLSWEDGNGLIVVAVIPDEHITKTVPDPTVLWQGSMQRPGLYVRTPEIRYIYSSDPGGGTPI